MKTSAALFVPPAIVIAIVMVSVMVSGSCRPSFSPTTLRAQARDAYNAKDFVLCADLFTRAKALSPEGAGSAYDAACCLALSGDKAAAFERLDRAIEAGYANDAHLLEDKDLESLRTDARFPAVVERVKARAAEKRKLINVELEQIYQDDQGDRQGDIDWKVVGPRDEMRRKRVDEILTTGGAKVAADFFHAAMVFQHGGDVAAYRRAHELALTAAELDPDHESARWLAAASKDRWLMNEGKPQLYGTQFRTVDGVWELYEVDPSITDEERARWGVPALAVAKARVLTMNKKPKELTLDDYTRLIHGGEPQWHELWAYAVAQPKRYAALTIAYGASPQGTSSLPYADFVHKNVEASEEFAKQNATIARVGFCQTSVDDLERLSNAEFPSTRRAGLEGLKRDTNGETFGYDWRGTPAANAKAIGAFAAWVKAHPPVTTEGCKQ